MIWHKWLHTLRAMASSRGPPDEGEPSEKPEVREEAVVNETEGVFRHFMYQRFQDEWTREEQEGLVDSAASARSDALEELRSCNDEAPGNHIVVIGRRLGEVGDEIDAKYKSEFQEMIEQLNLTHATAYETFAAIARRLFRSGINWGRIVALLCFGYEIAVSVIRQGFSGSFLRRIVRFVVDFVFRERIARWIADHGGWVSNSQRLFLPFCAIRSSALFIIELLVLLNKWLFASSLTSCCSVLSTFVLEIWRIDHLREAWNCSAITLQNCHGPFRWQRDQDNVIS